MKTFKVFSGNTDKLTMIELNYETNFDEYAKMLRRFGRKNIEAAMVRSMNRSLNTGMKVSSRVIKRTVNKPKDISWAGHVKRNIFKKPARGSGTEVSAALIYNSKARGLAAYVTVGRLLRHRKATSAFGFNNSGGAKKVAPLRIDLRRGKTTKISKAFVGKKKGKGKRQVFVRTGSKRDKISRPTAQSFAGYMRSGKNRRPRIVIEGRMQQRYSKDFSTEVRSRIDRIADRLARSKTRR